MENSRELLFPYCFVCICLYNIRNARAVELRRTQLLMYMLMWYIVYIYSFLR